MAQGPSTSTVLDTIWNSSRAMNSITGQHLPAKMSLRIWPILASTGVNLQAETAGGQECVAGSVCTPRQPRGLSETNYGSNAISAKGRWHVSSALHPQNSNSQDNAKCFHLIKWIRKERYQHNILLYKMTILRMIHVPHGYLVPDAYSARHLTVGQEYSAPGGSCFVLRFIYRISP